MKITRPLQYFALALASMGLAAPQMALAATPPAVAPAAQATVTDVALHGNVLAGQLVDAQGNPLAGAPVTVRQGNWPVAETQTTSNGVFAVHDLRGGVYTVEAGGAQGIYRVWTANTAPPAAKPAILMVHGQTTRGQFVGGSLGALGNPWVLGGIVATAVAIPIVLDDDDAS